MSKYGFVYIWFDSKHKRYYVGCHWGTEDDGYICSSSWMKQAYKHRPNDFTRKILARIYSNKREMIEEEYRWLQMIKPDELGTRYYNLHNHKFNHWSSEEYSDKKVKQKLSDVGKNISEETRQKMREAKLGKPSNSPTKFKKGQVPPNKGKPMSEELRLRLSEIAKSRPRRPCSEETKRKISEAQKGKPRKSGMEGKRHSEETKQKIRMTKQLNKNKSLELFN